MARPVRTSDLLRETAADHEALDRMAEQERLPESRITVQPPVQENASVTEKEEKKELSVQEKLDAVLPDDFFVNLRIYLVVRMPYKRADKTGCAAGCFTGGTCFCDEWRGRAGAGGFGSSRRKS